MTIHWGKTESLESNQEEWARWKHLLYISELIETLLAGSPTIPNVLTLFESLDSAFPKSLDPIEEPQAYAVRQFVKALKIALERSNS
jgi:hypothetical protein